MSGAPIGRQAEATQLRELLRSSPGAVVTGAMGVGKTHLVREVLAELASQGVTIVRIAATAASQELPLGAMAHLLPIGPLPQKPRELLIGMAAVIERLGGGRRRVVEVDDAHLLDPASAAVVHHLAANGTASIAATIRWGEPCPEAMVSLWKDAGAGRIELGDLAADDGRRLVVDLLGRPPTEELWAHLWRTGRGNPLFLTELVRGALESGAIRLDAEEAVLVGEVGPSDRLGEVIASRLGGYSVQARRVLEMLAIAEPLPIRLLEVDGGTAALAELERARLLTVTRTGARVEVRTAHPAIAETIKTLTPTSARRELAASLISRLEADPARSREDVLRVCVLSLEAGALPKPATSFLAAAAQALDRFDAELADRLVRPVLDADPVEARLVLGRSLRMRHRAAEADHHLAAAAGLVENDSQRTRVALELAQTQLYEERQPERAMTTLERARSGVTDRAWRQELDAMLALFATFTGDLTTAAEVGEHALQERVPTRAGLNIMAISIIAQVMLGRLEEAEKALQIALPLAAEAPPEAALAAELIAINEFSLDLCTGRLEESVHKAREGFRRAARNDRRDVVGAWGATGMLTLLPTGHVAEASRVGAEALAALELSDPLGLLPSAVAIRAYVLGHAGDPTGARALLAHPALAAASGETRTRHHVERAEVWATAAEGDVRRAARQALEGGLRALNAELITWGGILLHDAARFSEARQAARHLRDVSDHVGGELFPLLANHAEGLAAEDASAVLDASDRFAEIGAVLLAAEAAAQASALLLGAGHDREGHRAAARAHLLAGRCQGARTPALRQSPHPLTIRERQVALLAIGGRTNREIADELQLSKRTVDNHLASSYRKLGVSGREALALMLHA